MILYFRLMKCLLLLALIQLHVCTLVYRSSCRKDVLMKATDRSKQLVGSASNVIASLHAETLSLCTKKCIDASECKSQNYKKYISGQNEINCQLLDVNISSIGVSLSPAAGWVHYEPVNQVTPRCRSATCDAGYVCDDKCEDPGYVCKDVDECLSKPCKNGGTCSNLVNSYSCSCLPFYINTNCDSHMSHCTDHQTSYTEILGGKLEFLDRQTVSCGGSGRALITRFQADYSTASNIRYNFKCCHFKASFCSYSSKSGTYQERGNNNLNFLDRFDVDCGNDGYITQFSLSSSGTQLRYDYYCCSVKSDWRGGITCSDHATSWVNRINSLTALSLHNIVCNSGYALSYFRFQNNVGYTQHRYEYRCCKVA